VCPLLFWLSCLHFALVPIICFGSLVYVIHEALYITHFARVVPCYRANSAALLSNLPSPCRFLGFCFLVLLVLPQALLLTVRLIFFLVGFVESSTGLERAWTLVSC
jgi:hypothetical protein